MATRVGAAAAVAAPPVGSRAGVGAVAAAEGASAAVSMEGGAVGAEGLSAKAAAEEAFARLSVLYEQLPLWEERGAQLSRARSAAEVDDLHRVAGYRAAELREAEARVAQAQAAVAVAEADGADSDRLGDLRLMLMAAGTQRGLRVGPAQNAERAVRQALAASDFATLEEVQEALLSADALEALAAQVAAYQREYAEALALCQRLEADEDAAA